MLIEKTAGERLHTKPSHTTSPSIPRKLIHLPPGKRLSNPPHALTLHTTPPIARRLQRPSATRLVRAIQHILQTIRLAIVPHAGPTIKRHRIFRRAERLIDSLIELLRSDDEGARLHVEIVEMVLALGSLFRVLLGDIPGFDFEALLAVGVWRGAVHEFLEVEAVGGCGEALVFSLRSVEDFFSFRLALSGAFRSPSVCCVRACAQGFQSFSQVLSA